MSGSVSLLSGGLDSTVLAYVIKDRFPDEKLHFLSVYYGQRHEREIVHAKVTADKIGATWHVVHLVGFNAALNTSALLNTKESVPEGHYAQETMVQTVVPNRNMVLLSIAEAIALARHADRVGFAGHAGDHFIYPDCRPEFILAMEDAFLAGAGEVFIKAPIYAPFLNKTKAEIVEIGASLNVPFEDTWSCYQGGEVHCGKCGTCVERAEAFYLAGVKDPTEYQNSTYWLKATGRVTV